MARRIRATRIAVERIGAGLVLATLAGAPAAAGVRIGYVDVRDILEASPQAQAARDRIEREFAPRDSDLVARRNEIRTRQDELNRDAAVISAARRRAREAELGALKRELRRMRAWFVEDLNRRRSEEFGKLRSRVAEVIREVAESEGFDLVLTGGILYASNQVDITEVVMRRLENEQRSSVE